MNNRKKLILFLVILFVVIIGLIVLVAQRSPDEDLTPTDTAPTSSTSAVTNPSEETTNPATQQTQETESTEPIETTEPSQETAPDDTDNEETKPVETKPDETQSEETEPQETEPEEQGKSPWDVTYEEYQNMSATEQRAHMEAFNSIDEFFTWHDTAKKKHEAENPDIEVGGGDVVIPGGN